MGHKAWVGQVFGVALLGVVLGTPARVSAQTQPTTPNPYDTAPPAYSEPAVSQLPPDVEEKPAKPKEPKPGDFVAGGQVRLPNGPDEAGEHATFNWIAVDAKGRYYLLKPLFIDVLVPMALIRPDDVGGTEPKMFGAFSGTLNVRLPEMPFGPRNTNWKSAWCSAAVGRVRARCS